MSRVLPRRAGGAGSLVCAVSVVDEDRFIYASDYPHEQADDILHALCSLQQWADVSPRAKAKILRGNLKALYGL